MPTRFLDHLRSRLSTLGPRLLQSVGIVALTYAAFYVISSYVLPRLGVDGGPGSGLPPSLNITALLRQVKCEVNAATSGTIERGEPAMFQVTELEIEINFVVSQEAGSKTPTLVPISLESKVASQKVQRIKLTLGPADDINKPFEGKLSKEIERPTTVLLPEEGVETGPIAMPQQDASPCGGAPQNR